MPTERLRILLSNEQSFDLLFCGQFSTESGVLYFNPGLTSDPIFNHFVLTDRLLLGKLSEANFETLSRDLQDAGSRLEDGLCVFVEEFWPNRTEIETFLAKEGFRILEGMQILSKPLRQGESQKPEVQKSDRNRFSIRETLDICLWNDAFIRSYGIPESWRPELEEKLRALTNHGRDDSILVVATGEGEQFASGCLLLHLHPQGLMGVYCVGTIPSRRGLGLARAMLSYSESISAQKKSDVMTLQTIDSDNVDPMYLKLGYAVESRRRIFIN